MTFDQACLQPDMDRAFRSAVLEGLARPQKAIPSCWLYDQRGSELFDAITRLDEYYPTRAETEILVDHAQEIADFCGEGALLFEYGAGAGVKSEILLDAFADPHLYMPVDIAGDVLARTAARIEARFPALTAMPVIADFTRDFDLPPALPPGPRTAFFPGSTIGNMDRREAIAFLRRLRRHVQQGGQARGAAIVGVDLKKNIKTLIAAYDDAQGVTAAFNLNLLARINRAFSADLPVERFFHEARWNTEASAIEMHLVSRDARLVSVCGRNISFRAGESIHTESSRKYDRDAFAQIAETAGWQVAMVRYDRLHRFAIFGLEAQTQAA